MMHPIDAAIFTGTLTATRLLAAASEPLPPPGHSYWADRMREGHDAHTSAALAARDMGCALTSLAAVEARR